MRKLYVWALFTTRDRTVLHRFRSEQDRRDFLASIPKTSGFLSIEAIPANHPEVRRIQRRIAHGEQINFPVELKEE